MYRKRLAGAAGVVVLAVLLAGCGGEPAAAPGPKASPEASAEPSDSASASADPKAKERAAVLAAYRGMWREQAVAYRKASPEGTRLETYVSGEALAMLRLDLRQMKEAGRRANGRVGHEPEVGRVDLDASPPTAQLTDCIDLADWQETRDGEPLPMPSEQPMRYRASAMAEQWEDGRWRIITYTPHGEQTC
ncbi:hypothetical protein CLM85_15955 [Streptomyces albidoflavus]|uniref:hypothetical protein n=1 Tax=Streptomyces albidoflavus TaxID=1886 RepID=UPI000BAE5AE9|nr:hypothetical protein [Streptomyces albidoflavus]PAX83388.1 hypothetical protein CLM81_22430 [Streptomyces albidoflavus]PBO20213.1 hypothetical protein CLM83_01915 [Streptomyces albidoflavus]PBO23461.1 hypothetical protein CLM85_15955 [Streptomyces albidoflavus]PBO28930.1 hypothetical protein CLM84_17115 [Streptomyces albidoflavus]